MTEDELELAALSGIAWERRGTPEFPAAIEAILEWFDRRHIRVFERRERRRAACLQVLRDTNPQRTGRRRAA